MIIALFVYIDGIYDSSHLLDPYHPWHVYKYWVWRTFEIEYLFVICIIYNIWDKKYM